MTAMCCRFFDSDGKCLITQRLVDGIRGPFSDMENLLHQKVNTNEFACTGQSGVRLIEQIVLKINREPLQRPGTPSCSQAVKPRYQDGVNWDRVAVGRAPLAAKNGCVGCLLLQRCESGGGEKTQGSNSFVSSRNVDIGVDIVSRNGLNLLCRLVHSQKKQFFLLFKG